MDVDITGMAGLLRVRDGNYASDLLLAAIVRLDLLTVLNDDPGTLDELCNRNGIAYRPADVLVTLLRAMGLVEPGPVLRPTALARACLVRGAPYDLRPYLASGASRSTCVEQVELLRTGQPAAWTGGGVGVWPHDPAFGEYLSGGQARARVVDPPLVDLVEDLPVSAVLDVSGSDAFAKLVAERELDLIVEALGPGDLFVQYPDGYDAHLLTHTLHCWSERQARRIIGFCYDALMPGGWIIEHDTHLNADKTGPLPVAQYSALLLHATEGQCWSVGEIGSFMADAGFVEIRERPCGPDRSAITARKPEAR